MVSQHGTSRENISKLSLHSFRCFIRYFSSETDQIRFGRVRFRAPSSVNFWPSPRRVEFSESLSAECFCAKANSSSFSQNSATLGQNSETAFRPLPPCLSGTTSKTFLAEVSTDQS